MSRLQRIHERLQSLHPEICELRDDSHLHAGHAGAASGGGHFHLKISTAEFTGLNRINRHRLVYDALGELMHSEIHALSIEAYAPHEISA